MRPKQPMKRHLERMGVVVTGSPWAWRLTIGLTLLWGGAAHAPHLLPEAEEAEQPWTVDTRAPLMAVAEVARGALPSPLQGQHTRPEDCGWPAEMRNGACWIEVGSVKPPCTPPGNRRWSRLYPEDGRCWAPVLKAERPPTTGEPRPAGNEAPAGRP